MAITKNEPITLARCSRVEARCLSIIPTPGEGARTQTKQFLGKGFRLILIIAGKRIKTHVDDACACVGHHPRHLHRVPASSLAHHIAVEAAARPGTACMLHQKTSSENRTYLEMPRPAAKVLFTGMKQPEPQLAGSPSHISPCYHSITMQQR